jgi:hypothetical protein
MEKPAVGTVVHYVGSAPGKRQVCRAAIVTTTGNLRDASAVGLCVFNPQTPLFKGGVKADEGKKIGTYHVLETCGNETTEFEASPTV